MPMGPAEIVSSLKELCESKGPRLTTSQIVGWIDRNGGYESDAELIAFAKKMKARQFARMLTFEDEESGRRIKRLWSFRDSSTGTPGVRGHLRHVAREPEAVDREIRLFSGSTSIGSPRHVRLFRRPAVLRLLRGRGRTAANVDDHPERHWYRLESSTLS